MVVAYETAIVLAGLYQMLLKRPLLKVHVGLNYKPMLKGRFEDVKDQHHGISFLSHCKYKDMKQWLLLVTDIQR